MSARRIALIVLALWAGSAYLLPNLASAAESRRHEPIFASLNVGSMGLNWLLGFVKGMAWLVPADSAASGATGISQTRTGSKNNAIYNNSTGISIPNGQVASDGTNRVFGNGAS